MPPVSVPQTPDSIDGGKAGETWSFYIMCVLGLPHLVIISQFDDVPLQFTFAMRIINVLRLSTVI